VHEEQPEKQDWHRLPPVGLPMKVAEQVVQEERELAGEEQTEQAMLQG
jgi:hypothetical protein